MTTWRQVTVTSTSAEAERLGEVLESLGAQAVTLGDAADDPQLEPAPGATPLWRTTTVTGLFPGDTDLDPVLGRLADAVGDAIAGTVEVTDLEDREWERAWMDDYRPMRFGERLWVCPTGQSVGSGDAVVVWLDPGLAFGTGTHPSTALCLRWLERADVAGRTIVDYGCGSGILAIAALRLGARLAFAYDIDDQALRASRENALRNDVSERLVLGKPAIAAAAEPAELLVANIVSGTLIELGDTLAGLVRPGGRLAVSGILPAQEAAVVSAYRDAFRFDPPERLDGWSLLGATRREA